MGRVRQFIRVNGRSFWALFDPGSRNTYITEDVARHLTEIKLSNMRKVGLGGRARILRKFVVLEAKIKGKPIEEQAYVIEKLGKDEDNKEIKVLIGALAMQRWGIRVFPDEERIDMSRYPKEFVEF